MESRGSAAMGETANSFSCGMQRRRYLIPPLPPPLSNTHQPPAQLLVQGGLVFFSLAHITFQRPFGIHTCPCITLFAGNCCLVVLDQEQSPGENRAQ